jgi:hypothetical protein
MKKLKNDQIFDTSGSALTNEKLCDIMRATFFSPYEHKDKILILSEQQIKTYKKLGIIKDGIMMGVTVYSEETAEKI